MDNSNIVEQIYVINLNKNVSRFFNTLKYLQNINLSKIVSRFEAFDIEYSKKNKHNLIDPLVEQNINNLKNTGIIPTWGAVGCAASHIELWKIVSKMPNCNLALILEDDNEIYNKNDFLYNFFRLQQMYKSNNTSYSEVPFFATFDSTCNNKTQHLNTPFYHINSDIRGTSCYLINSFCAKTLLKNIFPLYYQIDIKIGLILKQIKYNYSNSTCLLVEKSGIRQKNDHISDVQYYFINIEDLKIIFKYLNFPLKIIEKIYYFMPKSYNLDLNTYDLYGSTNNSNFLYEYLNTVMY